MKKSDNGAKSKDVGGKDTSDKRLDVLLEDLKHIRSELVRNEDIGETRFKFFVGWITAVTGALVALALTQKPTGTNEFAFIKDPDKFFLYVTSFAIAGLLAIGLLTFCRLIHRNKATDHLGKMSDDVLSRVIAECGGLKSGKYTLVWPQKDGLSGYIRAGYAEIVGLIDGALFGTLLYVSGWMDIFHAVFLGALLGVALWGMAIRHRAKNLGQTTQGKEEFRKPPGAHA